MANKTKKLKVSARKNRRNKVSIPKPRNVHVFAARAMSGAGTHNDGRTRRCRGRGEQNRRAIQEHS